MDLAATALGAIKGAGQPPTDPKAAGLTTIQGFIRNGFPVGRWTLLFLAGVIPMLPFSSLGEYGMNLLVGGGGASAAVAMGAKAAASTGFSILANWLQAMRPALWPLIWLFRANPWYVFDILQTLSPAFEKDGYKIPFAKPATGRPPIAAPQGTGKVTPLSISMIIGILGASLYMLLQRLPPVVLGAAKPVLDIVAIAVGSLGALSMGGFGLVSVFPNILGGLGQAATDIKTVAASAAAAETASGPATPPQAGGGHVGSQMPPLREVASHLLGPDVAAYSSGILSGGGSVRSPSPPPNALFFWFTLMLVAGGGIALAASRS
jgi:hypothetical protein